jgi:hypothetical protein
MAEVTITTDEDQDDGPYVSISLAYWASLMAAKQELKRLKAQQTSMRDAADYLLQEHPDLLDYSGLTGQEVAEMYGEYDLYERGDC